MKLDELFSHWDHVRHGLLSTMDLYEEEELAYRPFGESWTVGDMMRHVAGAEAGWFQYVVMGKLDGWPAYEAEEYPTIESIQRLLAEVHAETMAYLSRFGLEGLDRPVTTPWGETITLGWVIWHVLEHEIHHRGELSLILGLLGREGLDV